MPDAARDVASALIRPGRGRSDVHRVRGAGPLRLLCPRAAGDAAWIVTSSLGGGLVDGDNVQLDVEVDAGATCVVTTQASTKIYKGASRQRLDVRVHGDGNVLVVPDAVVPFRDARFEQVTRVELSSDSTLVLGDVITAGRVAYGERWSAARIDATLSITVADAMVIHDRVVIERSPGRFDALATAVLLGPRVTDLATVELAALGAFTRRAPVIVSGSPIADGAMFRIAGERVEDVIAATRRLLRSACARLGEDPWARKW